MLRPPAGGAAVPALSPVHISKEGARLAVRLTRWVGGVGAAGNAVGQVGPMLGMSPSARQAWFNIVALVVVLTLIGGVLRCRGAGGGGPAAAAGQSALASFRGMGTAILGGGQAGNHNPNVSRPGAFLATARVPHPPGAVVTTGFALLCGLRRPPAEPHRFALQSILSSRPSILVRAASG